MSVIGDLPLFWPAAVLAVVCAAALAAPAARILGTPVWSALLLLAALGVILAATMTPSVAAFVPADRLGGCIRQFELPALSRLLYPNETSLNVVLFVPLGVACALLRRWSQVVLASGAAFGLPFAIELVQYEVSWLGRVCSTADIAANLTGLGLGLLAGIVVLRPISSWVSIDAVARGPR